MEKSKKYSPETAVHLMLDPNVRPIDIMRSLTASGWTLEEIAYTSINGLRLFNIALGHASSIMKYVADELDYE